MRSGVELTVFFGDRHKLRLDSWIDLGIDEDEWILLDEEDQDGYIAAFLSDFSYSKPEEELIYQQKMEAINYEY